MQLQGLNTKALGRNAIYFKTIDSTQNEIFRLIESGIPQGTLVMADIQTAGKGTHGRVWHTDVENNIAFSLYMKLDCSVRKIEGITIEIARIILKVMENLYGITLEIKEPNDIVFENKKIGGILTQSKIVNEKVKYIVVGIGINTSQMEFTEDVENIATSIKKEFNVDVNVKKFIAEFCNRFEAFLLTNVSN